MVVNKVLVAMQPGSGTEDGIAREKGDLRGAQVFGSLESRQLGRCWKQ